MINRLKELSIEEMTPLRSGSYKSNRASVTAKDDIVVAVDLAFGSGNKSGGVT